RRDLRKTPPRKHEIQPGTAFVFSWPRVESISNPTFGVNGRLPSRESDPDTAVDQPRRADRGWVRLDEVHLVEEVLRADKHLQVTAEVARCRQIHDRISRQPRRRGRVVAGVGPRGHRYE